MGKFVDEMTPVERKKALEKGERVDRLPCVPFMEEVKCKITGQSIPDYWHRWETMVQIEKEVFQRFGHDRLLIGPNSYGISESLGAEVIYPEHNMPHMGKPLIDTYEKVKELEPVQPQKNKRMYPFLEAAKVLGETMTSIVPVEASVGGPFTIAAYLRGTEKLLRDLRKHSKEVHELLRLVTESEKNCIKEATKYGLGIALADPVASPELIGEKYYKEFAYPYMKELTEYAASLGQKPSLHMCGKTYSIWKYFREYPLNEISLDNIIDLERAVEELSDAVPITGNIPPVEVMLNGEKEDIFEAVKHCISIGKKAKKGYTVATGCDLPVSTDPRKIEYMMEAVREFS